MRSQILVCGALLGASVTLFAAAAPKAKPAPVRSSSALKISPTVRQWMSRMTLRDEVAQLVFIGFNGEAPNTRSREYRRFLRLIQETRVGGLILVNWSNGRAIQKAEPYELAAFLNRMQRIARVPLLVGGDFERGASMRVDGTTAFPHAMAFAAAGDPAFSRLEGEVTAREARALGVHWVYYPVADVNNNPDNPIINIRSFGEDPQMVSDHVKAFIEGARSDRKNVVITSAKHFPGHGDTAVDTHMNLAVIPGDRARLNRVELAPFRSAIDAGVDSIMTAHVAVPALSAADLPATLAPAILTDLLRKEMGYNGIIVTDALEMGGITQRFSAGEAAVRALEAGADTLLMPADAEAAIKGVVAAVQSGRLTRKRIQQSVARILAAKEKVGLHRRRYVTLDAIEDSINAPEAAEKAQEIANRAITLLRNQENAARSAARPGACFVVMPESRFSSSGQSFTQEVRARRPKASIQNIDSAMPRAIADEAIAKLGSCQSYTVAAFASVGAYRGGVGLTGELPYVVETLISSGRPVTMVALGNPYLLRSFPKLAGYFATFSNVAVSELAAVKALFAEIPITGRSPVSIPGMARFGDGIQLPATIQ